MADAMLLYRVWGLRRQHKEAEAEGRAMALTQPERLAGTQNTSCGRTRYAEACGQK